MIVSCANCGVEFKTFPCKIADGRGIYCSVKCKAEGAINKPISERFWKNVKKTGGCWIWTGYAGNYGTLTINKEIILAHRFSYELHNGKIKDGLFVLHKCDNRLCVNPEHLFLGSHQDNMADRNNKKRQAVGENHGLSKLTKSDVLKIRKLNGVLTQAEIGKMFDVSATAIGCIITKKTWKHV